MRTLILTPFIPEQDPRASRLAAYVRGAGGAAEVAGVSGLAPSVESTGEVASPRPGGRGRRRFRRYLRTWSILGARSSLFDQVVAVNCEVGIVSWLFRLVHGRRFRLVLDVYDHHGDIFESRVLSSAFAVLELAAAVSADAVILPTRERVAQYPGLARAAVSRKALFISNAGFDLPRSSRAVMAADRGPASYDGEAGVPGPLRIVYCGNVDFSRGLDTLIAAVEATAGRWQLDIHGGGVAFAALEALAAAGANVRLHGPFRTAELVERAAGADLYWAAYDLRVANNRYCDPNKFRDHVILDVPILTNPGHPLAHLVERSQSGFVVPLDVVALRGFLDALDRRELARRLPSMVRADAVLSSVIAANRAGGDRVAFGTG